MKICNLCKLNWSQKILAQPFNESTKIRVVLNNYQYYIFLLISIFFKPFKKFKNKLTKILKMHNLLTYYTKVTTNKPSIQYNYIFFINIVVHNILIN